MADSSSSSPSFWITSRQPRSSNRSRSPDSPPRGSSRPTATTASGPAWTRTKITSGWTGCGTRAARPGRSGKTDGTGCAGSDRLGVQRAGARRGRAQPARTGQGLRRPPCRRPGAPGLGGGFTSSTPRGYRTSRVGQGWGRAARGVVLSTKIGPGRGAPSSTVRFQGGPPSASEDRHDYVDLLLHGVGAANTRLRHLAAGGG